VVAENYPQLKANEKFRDLQAQSEGTENRITLAQSLHQGVQEYNITVRSSEQSDRMLFGFQVKPSFTVEDERKSPTALK